MTRGQLLVQQSEATDAQLSYLRRLLNEAFAHHYEHGSCLDAHHLDRTSKQYASQVIGDLKAAKERGWK